MLFKDLDIIKPILNALDKQGYKKPTPIQEKAIPHILDGRDVLGAAQTWTGKTAAFAIPTLQILSREKQLLLFQLYKFYQEKKNYQISRELLNVLY